jgi:GTP-binding protein HflX
VLNKVDVAERGQVAALLGRYPRAVAVSAKGGQALAELAQAASRALSRGFLDVDVETGVDNGRLLAQLASYGEVLSKRYTDSRVIVHCRIPERAMAQLRSTDTYVRPHGANGRGEKNGQARSGETPGASGPTSNGDPRN